MSRWADFGFPNPTFLPYYIPLTGIRLAENERRYEKKNNSFVVKKDEYGNGRSEEEIRMDVLRNYIYKDYFYYPIIDRKSPIFSNTSFLIWKYGYSFSIKDDDIPSMYIQWKDFLQSCGYGDYCVKSEREYYYYNLFNEYFEQTSTLRRITVVYDIINKLPQLPSLTWHFSYEEDGKYPPPATCYSYKTKDGTYVYTTSHPSRDIGNYYFDCYYDMSSQLEFLDRDSKSLPGRETLVIRG